MNMGGQRNANNRRSLRQPRPPWLLTIASLTLMVVRLSHSSLTCGHGTNAPGVTYPRGDIIVEHGNPLNITCVLDPDNDIVKRLYAYADAPSRSIVFTRNGRRVSQRYVSVVNETAARLHAPDVPRGNYVYNCNLITGRRRLRDDGGTDADDTTPVVSEPPPPSTVQPTSLETSGPPSLVSGDDQIGVCMNSVAVGNKPSIITNISCISNNWASLTCNWTIPENPVRTEYKIYFALLGRPGRHQNYNCPTDSDVISNTCYWSGNTTPIYRQPYEYYRFTIIGENPLGKSNSKINFHHYANVIPASPTDITVVERTHSSAMVRWSIGDQMTVFARIVQKIEYKSQWDPNPNYWHTINVSDVCNASLTNQNTSKLNCPKRNGTYDSFNVTDLLYPFTQYDFRIFVRSSVARNEDKWWSAPGCITLKTKPTIPKRPPRTDIGGFESVVSQLDNSKRDIFVYWQNINDSEKNGDLFEYRVVLENITVYATTLNYAKLEGFDVNTEYYFKVFSANKEGLSAEFSIIFVPKESDKLKEPVSFTKMAFVEQAVFELSWKNASHENLLSDNQIKDYTIFWCDSDKDRPYQCDGFLNWIHVPNTVSCYNISVSNQKKNYQFAISANRRSITTNSLKNMYEPVSSSSGMVWASCTVLHNNIVGKIKDISVNVNSTYMVFKWKLGCSDRIGAILGYRIFFCPVVFINNSVCNEPMVNKTVDGEIRQDYGIAKITGLKPYTTYLVSIALITNYGEGVHSDPSPHTTLEDAPNIEDLKINVKSSTNTSVTIQWSPPKSANGIIRYYNVYYYLDDQPLQQELINALDNQQPVNEQRHITVNQGTMCLIEHLESYRYYKVTVRACTAECSNHSSPLTVRTDIGRPGQIGPPNVIYENSTTLIVSWLRPTKPAGPVDYYQLLVMHQNTAASFQTSNDGYSSPLELASPQIRGNSKDSLYHSKSPVFYVSVPECNNEHSKEQTTYYFIVRAVNNNPHDPNRPFYGQWSVPVTSNCVSRGFPLALHLVIWSCLFIVLTSVFTFTGKRFWRKYKVMRNVQVVLPPTLNISYKFDHFKNYNSSLSSDLGQQCLDEDGLVVQNDATAASVTLNANPTYGCNTIEGSGSDRQVRWSPATTTTTASVADGDDTSSSSKHHLITPLPLPTMNRSREESLGDENSVNSNDDAIAQPSVLEPPPVLEPVLPFFTLPEIAKPPPTTANGRSGGAVCRKNSGYQDSGMVIIVNSAYRDVGKNRTNGVHRGSRARDEAANTAYRDVDKTASVVGGVEAIGVKCDGRSWTDVPVAATESCDRKRSHDGVGDQTRPHDTNRGECSGENPLPPPLFGNRFPAEPLAAASDENHQPPCQRAEAEQPLSYRYPDDQPQRNDHRLNSGYCGRDMIIATCLEHNANHGGGEQPHQPAATCPGDGGPVEPKTAYVMLDLVPLTPVAARQRLLDLERLDSANNNNKPAIVAVQPLAAGPIAVDVVDCGGTADQR